MGSAVGNFIMNYDAGNSYFDMKKSLEDLVDKKLPAELGFSEEDGIFVKNPRRSLGKQIKQILDEDDNYITTCE